MTALVAEEQQSAVEAQECEGTTAAMETTINQEKETAVVTQEVEEEHHPTQNEIEEYEESQRKFRELWEKKREKVSEMISDFLLLVATFYAVSLRARSSRGDAENILFACVGNKKTVTFKI